MIVPQCPLPCWPWAAACMLVKSLSGQSSSWCLLSRTLQHERDRFEGFTCLRVVTGQGNSNSMNMKCQSACKQSNLWILLINFDGVTSISNLVITAYRMRRAFRSSKRSSVETQQQASCTCSSFDKRNVCLLWFATDSSFLLLQPAT